VKATRRTLAAAASVALALLAAAGARADVFSPGELPRGHEKLEGLSSCTKCHQAGEQLAAERCLDCHRELAGRVAQGRGFHGRMPAAERACWRCHHEHQGRGFPLVDWGKGGRKGFDHAKTGFDLRGKHARVDCARCHDARLVADPGVKELLARAPARETFLGAPQACASCHFDEHRGQLGADCQRCHGEDAWKPVRRFDHAQSRYPLTGKHAKVECARCHKAQEEPARTAASATTPPVHPASFVRYKPVPFDSCLDCHKDPHQGRFGASCQSCHDTSDWRKVTGAGAQKAFHDRTRYPLRGRHVEVRCEACHGPFPGMKAAQYRGLAFAACLDCHVDSHVGQLAARGDGATAAHPPGACERCHSVDGWLPVRFEGADHDGAAYRLEGAHRAVACALCHPKDPRLAARLPAAVKAELERKRRPVQVSLAVLDVPRASDCRTCHRDPHAGQLDARAAEKGCATCHGLDTFRKARFDHQQDSRFPLTGQHAKAACATCHRPDAKGVIQYRPLELACASCHADVHAGQLAVKGQGTDCARCHGTESWKTPLRFRHEQPFTGFALTGKHVKVECAKCHGVVRVSGAEVRRYRGVPTSCEGCHADFHRGAFRGYVP
jgi:hypothetical protein